jgi:hypothetical protein
MSYTHVVRTGTTYAALANSRWNPNFENFTSGVTDLHSRYDALQTGNGEPIYKDFKKKLRKSSRGRDRSRRRRALVRVDDLAAGRKPDLITLLHVRERAFEILNPQRLTSDHRMQRNAYHPRLLRTVGV